MPEAPQHFAVDARRRHARDGKRLAHGHRRKYQISDFKFTNATKRGTVLHKRSDRSRTSIIYRALILVSAMWAESAAGQFNLAGFVLVARNVSHDSRPFLRRQRPALVIAPLAGDFQVSGRESFHPESEPLNQTSRCVISSLNVCFQPVKANRPKSP